MQDHHSEELCLPRREIRWTQSVSPRSIRPLGSPPQSFQQVIGDLATVLATERVLDLATERVRKATVTTDWWVEHGGSVSQKVRQFVGFGAGSRHSQL